MGFRAVRVGQVESGVRTEQVELDDSALGEGDVTVAVEFSTVNYKDGLAVTHGAPIVRRFPLIPGIDFAGTVTASDSPEFAVGDKVVLNGWGHGESRDGGFTEKARVPAAHLVRLPDGIDTRRAAAIGTAGYTAMLCVMALERAGIRPDRGEILVTGANGGVGSVAIALLSGLGFRVVASTGRPAEADYLKRLGASELIERASLSEPGKPLARERWAGAVDSVGSRTLVNVLAQTRYGGTVAACGLAQGNDLPGSVLPFILRGVTLAGVDSVQAPKPLRIEAWQRLARDLDPGRLESMITKVGLADAAEAARSILKGQVRGRVLVDVRA